MKIKKKEFNHILLLLANFVEFTENQQKEDLIDGACDPDVTVTAAYDILDKYAYGWRKEKDLLPVKI